MREFWHRFTTNLYWFLGTLIFGFIIFLLFYNLINPEGYNITINSWFQSLKELFGGLLTIGIVCIGIGIMLKGLFGKKGHK